MPEIKEEQVVTVKSLAEELAIDRSVLRKFILKHGIALCRVRNKASRFQPTLALTTEDAEQVRVLRRSNGYAGAGVPVHDSVGVFYVVQVVPEFCPKRVKLGYAADVKSRMDAHRCVAPTAQMVKSWPCKRHWEQVAIDSATRAGCTPLSGEVFDVDSVEALLRRADEFFALMPIPR